MFARSPRHILPSARYRRGKWDKRADSIPLASSYINGRDRDRARLETRGALIVHSEDGSLSSSALTGVHFWRNANACKCQGLGDVCAFKRVSPSVKSTDVRSMPLYGRKQCHHHVGIFAASYYKVPPC